MPESELEEASKGDFRGAGVVVHLYDADSRLGASLDLLLEAKAGSYMGTRCSRAVREFAQECDSLARPNSSVYGEGADIENQVLA